MKNIHILPTNKPSRLFENSNGNLILSNVDYGYLSRINRAIYITNDEEIKEGDWVVFNELEIVKCTYSKNGEFLFSEPLTSSSNHHFSYFKKIILTTDQDLIKDGVQAIDDEFLQWIVKNPSCEEVEINSVIILKESRDETDYPEFDYYNYEIIIPKEELERGITITHVGKQEELDYSHLLKPVGTKKDRSCTNNCSDVCGECQILETKQETLEEAAERLYDDNLFGYEKYRDGFINGAKWQHERSYSEEEVHSILNSFKSLISSGYNKPYFDWFEQFKKEVI